MTMRIILRAALGLCGGLALMLALGFLAQPETSAARLGLSAVGPVGLSTLRGDMTGLFALIGGFAVAAAVRERAIYLVAPAVLVSVILVGRGVSAVVDGSGGGSLPLIGVEVAMLAVMLWGLKALPGRIRA